MSQCDGTEAGKVKVWSDPIIPSDATIIMMTKGFDDTGCKIDLAYRLPMSAIAGGTNNRDVSQISVAAPLNSIDIPEGLLVPIYQENSDPFRLIKADATGVSTLATAIAVQVDPNDQNRMIVQSSGFYKFEEPHGYDVGQTYYLSDESGELTTTPGTEEQAVLRVWDATTVQLLI